MKKRQITLTIESPDRLNHDPVTDERIRKAIEAATGGSALLRVIPGSLVVSDAAELRIERRDTGGFAIHPFGSGDPDDADVSIYDNKITWASLGGRTPAEARAFAFALLKAAEIIEAVDGGDGGAEK